MCLGIDQPSLTTAEKEAKPAQAKTQDQHLLVSNTLNHRNKMGDPVSPGSTSPRAGSRSLFLID